MKREDTAAAPGTSIYDLPGEIVNLEGAKAQRDRRRREAPVEITTGQWEDLHIQITRLCDNVHKLALLAAGTQQRQVEMRADLLKAGAFEKKSSLILPGEVN